MASNYWIKLYHEMLDDPKIGRLTDGQFRLTINLFLLAGDYEQDGYLPPVDDIRWRLRNPENIEENIEELKRVGILEVDGDLLVTHFSERQSAMSPTERTQRRRKKLHKSEYYGNAHETIRDTDIDKDIDKDKILINNQNFFSKFQAIAGPLMGNQQTDLLKDIVSDHGEEKVLEIARWLVEERSETSMHKILKAINTAAPTWGKKKKPLEAREFLRQEVAKEQEAVNGN